MWYCILKSILCCTGALWSVYTVVKLRDSWTWKSDRKHLCLISFFFHIWTSKNGTNIHAFHTFLISNFACRYDSVHFSTASFEQAQYVHDMHYLNEDYCIFLGKWCRGRISTGALNLEDWQGELESLAKFGIVFVIIGQPYFYHLKKKNVPSRNKHNANKKVSTGEKKNLCKKKSGRTRQRIFCLKFRDFFFFFPSASNIVRWFPNWTSNNLIAHKINFHSNTVFLFHGISKKKEPLFLVWKGRKKIR